MWMRILKPRMPLVVVCEMTKSKKGLKLIKACHQTNINFEHKNLASLLLCRLAKQSKQWRIWSLRIKHDYGITMWYSCSLQMSNPCSSLAIYLSPTVVLGTDMRLTNSHWLTNLMAFVLGIAWDWDCVLKYSTGYNLIFLLKIVGKHGKVRVGKVGLCFVSL
jgi:hypothetical protein